MIIKGITKHIIANPPWNIMRKIIFLEILFTIHMYALIGYGFFPLNKLANFIPIVDNIVTIQTEDKTINAELIISNSNGPSVHI